MDPSRRGRRRPRSWATSCPSAVGPRRCALPATPPRRYRRSCRPRMEQTFQAPGRTSLPPGRRRRRGTRAGGSLNGTRHHHDGVMATTKTKPAADLVYLCRALKAPTLACSVERLGEQPRADARSHEEFLAASLSLSRRAPARRTWPSVCRSGPAGPTTASPSPPPLSGWTAWPRASIDPEQRAASERGRSRNWSAPPRVTPSPVWVADRAERPGLRHLWLVGASRACGLDEASMTSIHALSSRARTPPLPSTPTFSVPRRPSASPRPDGRVQHAMLRIGEFQVAVKDAGDGADAGPAWHDPGAAFLT